MILWGESIWLIALIAPVAMLLLELVLRVRAGRERSAFASASLWPRLAPGRSFALRRWKRWLIFAALTLLIIGLANPRIGTRYEEVTREGIDIILIVDVSRSMDTRDIRPSRLTKSRYELDRFLEGLKGDRVGVVPFAGIAYPLCPLTLDYAAASMFIDLLATDLIPTPGTAIAEAIETALASFPGEDGRGQAIVLISDGEDHEGGAVEAARQARKADTPIYTIGMALGKGDPVPNYDRHGQPDGWVLDESGQIVTSRLNEELLRAIAKASRGEYYRASQGGEEFRKVYRTIFGFDRKQLETRRITDFEDRFQPLLALSLLLLAIEFALPAGRRRKP